MLCACPKSYVRPGPERAIVEGGAIFRLPDRSDGDPYRRMSLRQPRLACRRTELLLFTLAVTQG